MAAVVTRMIPTAAFAGVAGMANARKSMELWNVVLSGGTTVFTVTCFALTHPERVIVWSQVDASVVALPATISVMTSGTSTVAFTGGSNTTYVVAISGGT